jgi:glucosamine-6-phosphate deaminase
MTGISVALAKCVEKGVNHMWTVSAIQMHPKGLIVSDEDATMELHVKVNTVLFLGKMRLLYLFC